MFRYPTTERGMHVPEFVHLHVHSHFSFGRGAASPVELVAAAHAQGARTLALTDRNNLYGLIWFLMAAQEAGIRPLVGAEIDAEDADAPGSATRLLPGREPESEGSSATRPAREWRRSSKDLELIATQRHSRNSVRGSVIQTARYVPRATLLARNRAGYTNLCRLLTARHSDPEFDLTNAKSLMQEKPGSHASSRL